jgi:hypothetical protein
MLAEDEEDTGPRSELLEGISTLPSVCISCEENGKTNIFPTSIPFFRDVIVIAFRCQHCGYRNSEVQEMEIQEKGSRFTLQVKTPQVSAKICGINLYPNQSILPTLSALYYCSAVLQVISRCTGSEPSADQI